MAITKSSASVTDWTAVAANAVGESATVDLSALYGAILHIQAFLDSETANGSGSEFIVQVSANSSGDEDWTDYYRFVDLVGTANAEAITNNPLAAGSTTITCASTTGYTVSALASPWRAIEDSTLANSELILQTGVTTNTNITILDGTTNSHAQSTNMYSLAMVKDVLIPLSYQRARVVVNNNYTSSGSSLNYKVMISKITAV